MGITFVSKVDQTMAYFKYASFASNECLITSFQDLLKKADLEISQDFSSSNHIFAEQTKNNLKQSSKIKVFISWIDRSIRSCSVEIRSDEPHLMRNTFCEKLANQLEGLIPPSDLKVRS
tara:strand:- start:60 stop:416 length:357 start_codon:yes stop_codon:yes gene_type:complete